MSLLLLLTVVLPSFAQQVETTIHFELDKYDHVESLHNNAESYSGLDQLLNYILADSINTIDRIIIRGNTSPEAGRTYNQKLSQNRANAIRNYITLTHKIDSTLITSMGEGIQWDYLHTLVSDSEIEYRDEILSILENVEEETWQRVNPNDRWLTLTDSRLHQLMNLHSGDPYRYLATEFFPLMRNSSVVTVIYSHHLPVEVPPLDYDLTLPELKSYDISPQTPSRHYAFAVKSNLLYDALTIANIELEFPLGQRFSITGEYTFPWWYGAKSNFTMRTQMGHLGLNYWLGDRNKREVLTGWHIGVMAGYAPKYDTQIFSESGIQGDYKMAGVNVGYAHTIYKSLRLEYQLGVGYMRSDYRNYTMAYDTRYGDIKVFDYPWELRRKTWIGPTQARVSLAWLINCKKSNGDEK